MSSAAPLRFLALVLGGWVAARAALLAPAWMEGAEIPKPILVDRASASPKLQPRAPAETEPSDASPASVLWLARKPLLASLGTGKEEGHVQRATALHILGGSAIIDGALHRPALPTSGRPPRMPLPAGPMPLLASSSRWSVSAWAFVRRGEGRQLATGGTLGGSQAGARVAYRLGDEFSLSGRFSAPLRLPDGAEAALGLEWQPFRSAPLRLLAERRQAVGSEGRSAFALLAHGGVSDRRLLGPVTLDAYAQAGIVGTRSRDAFADGAVRLAVPLDEHLSLGIGAWGAAQPGASRLDAGPQASYRLPLLGGDTRLSAEWRLRIAGSASPGSGPALTLSTDF